MSEFWVKLRTLGEELTMMSPTGNGIFSAKLALMGLAWAIHMERSSPCLRFDWRRAEVRVQRVPSCGGALPGTD